MAIIKWIVLAAMLGLSESAQPASTGASLEKGLLATYTSLSGAAKIIRDVEEAPQVRCYVAAGESPTPFLPAGKFDVAWRGYVSVDLRSEYYFQADVAGDFKLLINGKSVLEFKSEGGSSPLSQPIRLNKGTNAIVATLASVEAGDTFVRLHWSDTETAIRPIPAEALSRPAEVTPLVAVRQQRLGRELFIEYRCASCHATPQLKNLPEASMDAPTFEAIGGRRAEAWLARWILDPPAVRPGAHMPRIFHGTNAPADAAAIAAYLTSSRDGATSPPERITPELKTAGEELFNQLLCAGCHTPGDAPAQADKISLANVNAKFIPGALRAFLLEPARHYRWIRMPNFRLNETEASQLAAYLRSNATPPPDSPTPSTSETIARGASLIQTAGCLNCHQLNAKNQITTWSLLELYPETLTLGCLATAPDPASPAPRFQFSTNELAALRLFLGGDRAALGRHVPSEFAARQTRLLSCNACHGQHETFPALEVIGAKLTPEWMTDFIGGKFLPKPRPWVAARMPAFPTHAEHLAQGLATRHGFSARTPALPPLDMAAARVGQKLIGKDGGFSCVSCHAVRDMKAMEVFESEGINLAYSGSRLQYPYFRRWLLDPLLIDPQTKMPDYFDGHTSPLTEVYEGDARQQINAIWNYLRLGEKMPLPIPGQTQ